MDRNGPSWTEIDHNPKLYSPFVILTLVERKPFLSFNMLIYSTVGLVRRNIETLEHLRKRRILISVKLPVPLGRFCSGHPATAASPVLEISRAMAQQLE